MTRSGRTRAYQVGEWVNSWTTFLVVRDGAFHPVDDRYATLGDYLSHLDELEE